jgi:2-methylcitrate dehydratase PrpD
MPGDSTISGQLAGFLHDLTFDDLPASVVEQAKSRVLDALATALEARDLPVPGAVLKWLSGNIGRATVIGHGLRLPAADAAFVNATLVNGCTHDDFLEKSHAGAVTLPAALAIAEQESCSGRDLIVGMVAGYEATARAYLGCPGMVPDFRATGVAGAIGAAAAAGKLLRLDASGLRNALGCSTMFASGFGEGFLTGTMDVKLNVGWASRSGVSAAMLARCGATSAPTAFEGVSGFCQAFGGTVEYAARALQGLGERFLIEDVIYKECPVCIFVQTPVYLARTLAEERPLDPARIRRVALLSPEGSYNNPGFKNMPPYINPLQARISAPFAVAAALLGHEVESYAYYERYADPEVAALAAKIELLPPVSGNTDHVRLEVDYDGETIVRGGIEMETLRPTLDKLVRKFTILSRDVLGDAANEVLDTVMELDRIGNIDALTRLLQVAVPARQGQGERRMVVA